MSRQEKLANLFLVFPGQLKTRPNTFHSYSFIKPSANETFRHFLVNFIERLSWKRKPLQKFQPQFSSHSYYLVALEKDIDNQNLRNTLAEKMN